MTTHVCRLLLYALPPATAFLCTMQPQQHTARWEQKTPRNPAAQQETKQQTPPVTTPRGMLTVPSWWSTFLHLTYLKEIPCTWLALRPYEGHAHRGDRWHGRSNFIFHYIVHCCTYVCCRLKSFARCIKKVPKKRLEMPMLKPRMKGRTSSFSWILVEYY